MRPPHASRRSGTWAVVLAMGLIVALLLPALYVASAGPAYWLAYNGWAPWSVYHGAYRPLRWACDKWPRGNVLLDSYLQWWAPPPPTIQGDQIPIDLTRLD
jgi:hypothetical protein